MHLYIYLHRIALAGHLGKEVSEGYSKFSRSVNHIHMKNIKRKLCTREKQTGSAHLLLFSTSYFLNPLNFACYVASLQKHPGYFDTSIELVHDDV